MIRDVVVHLSNEQPMLADLEAMPTAADACLVCTNLRTMTGTKPQFTDRLDSWFLIPLGMVRFVEVPKRSVDQVQGIIPLHASTVRREPADAMDFDPEVLRRLREA